MGGAGVQGPPFSWNSQGLRVWKPRCLSLLLSGTPSPASSFLLPSQLKSHLLWVSILVAPRVPKDSVLIKGLISRSFNFFLPFCLPHSNEWEPWSCVTSATQAPAKASGQSQCF